jgi:hypothetical protein
MTEPEKDQRPAIRDEAQTSSPLDKGEAFQRAESQLAEGNHDSSGRAHDALSAIEGGVTSAQPSSGTDGSDALTRRRTGDEHGDDAELDEALEDKALEDGMAAAKDTAQIVQALTPHNL